MKIIPLSPQNEEKSGVYALAFFYADLLRKKKDK
jgi:hypothetical protein